MPPSTTSTWPVMYDGVIGREERPRRRRCRPACRGAPAGSAPASAGARLGRHRRRHVGLDEARRDGVREDVAATPSSLATRLREADQPRLARGVVRLPLVAGDADDAGDVDDAAPAPLHHAARRRADGANAPRRFASITASQSSSLRRSSRLSRVRPALFTRMSSRPKRLLHRLDERGRPARRPTTSQAKPARATPDLPPRRPRRAPARGRRRRRARPAPASVSAMARPMPRVLPVTSATRPLRSICMMATERVRQPSDAVRRFARAAPRCPRRSTRDHLHRRDLLHEPVEHRARTHLHEQRVGMRARRAPARRRSSCTGAVSCSSEQRRARRRARSPVRAFTFATPATRGSPSAAASSACPEPRRAPAAMSGE